MDTAEKGISELKDMSIETSQTEKQRKHWTQHSRTMGQFLKANIYVLPKEEEREKGIK